MQYPATQRAISVKYCLFVRMHSRHLVKHKHTHCRRMHPLNTVLNFKRCYISHSNTLTPSISPTLTFTVLKWPGNMPARPTVFLYRALHIWHTVEAHSLRLGNLNCPHCQTQHTSTQRCKEIPSPSIPHNAPQSCLHISAQTLLSVSAAEGSDWRLALAPQSRR